MTQECPSPRSFSSHPAIYCILAVRVTFKASTQRKGFNSEMSRHKSRPIGNILSRTVPCREHSGSNGIPLLKKRPVNIANVSFLEGSLQAYVCMNKWEEVSEGHTPTVNGVNCWTLGWERERQNYFILEMSKSFQFVPSSTYLFRRFNLFILNFKQRKKPHPPHHHHHQTTAWKCPTPAPPTPWLQASPPSLVLTLQVPCSLRGANRGAPGSLEGPKAYML